MSYQELVVMDSVKVGLMDTIPVVTTFVNPSGDVWDSTTHIQGLRYPNDGKTILIASNMKVITPTTNEASWEDTQAQAGTYSAFLDKPALATDGSTHVQFTPTVRLTFQDLVDAIATGGAGALNPEWSFWYYLTNVAGNYVQFEFRFEDPGSDAWLEVTALPLQGNAGGIPGPWTQSILTGAMLAGSGGQTPDGSSVFLWAPPGTLANLETDVVAGWNHAVTGEPGTGAATANYILERVRLELWEAALARSCYVDTVVLDGVPHGIEPGMLGGQLSKPLPIVTLTFVVHRDMYGRTETLAPVVGAEQTLIVGPLSPALFNDSDGYVKFEPSLGDVEVSYRVIRVSNPS